MRTPVMRVPNVYLCMPHWFSSTNYYTCVIPHWPHQASNGFHVPCLVQLSTLFSSTKYLVHVPCLVQLSNGFHVPGLVQLTTTPVSCRTCRRSSEWTTLRSQEAEGSRGGARAVLAAPEWAPKE